MPFTLKKVYMGFAVDMDRAYDTNARDGRPIRLDHPQYKDRLEHKRIFTEGMEKLFKYFKSINAEKSVTWFVNEASFNTTTKFPEIIKKCIDTGGEIGLHTHFNSAMFKSSTYTMPENPAIWEKEGIIKPKKRLEKFLNIFSNNQKKIKVFKAGNHIRNKEMFNKLVENDFEIDTTCVCNHKEVRNIDGKKLVLFNDENISMEPFEFITDNGSIFEIPECSGGRKKLALSGKKEIYCRLQVHPWEAFQNHLNEFSRIIYYLKKHEIEIEFMNCEDMKKTYLKNNISKYHKINVDNK